MDGEKSTLEKVTETVKEAMETIVEGAKSMVSPEFWHPDKHASQRERGRDRAGR